MRGVVKWFDKKKGYGFIKSSEHAADIFIHFNDIAGDDEFKVLIDGQNVEFEAVPADRGLKAKNVRVVTS